MRGPARREHAQAAAILANWPDKSQAPAEPFHADDFCSIAKPTKIVIIRINCGPAKLKASIHIFQQEVVDDVNLADFSRSEASNQS